MGADVRADSLQIAGCRLASVEAGLCYQNRRDLVLFELAPGTSVSALTTRNQVVAAPVLQLRQHLGTFAGQLTDTNCYWLVNAGQANAVTGPEGLEDCRRHCTELAEMAGVPVERVLPFSTGLVSGRIPLKPMLAALPKLLAGLSEVGWEQASEAILTTDTRPKLAWRELSINGQTVRLAGIAKGAAMIKPDMATTLSFVATDAAVPPELAQQMHRRAVDATFNRICVEGDTSTNDCSTLAATGLGQGRAELSALELPVLEQALRELLAELAAAVVSDAEGAGRLVRIEVGGGGDVAECRQVADTLARSVLVKTCLAAGDPNWGRLLVALGYSGIENLELDKVSVWLGDVLVFENGAPAPDYREEQGAEALAGREQRIRLDLGRGTAEDYALTCDLTVRYVQMNSELRS